MQPAPDQTEPSTTETLVEDSVVETPEAEWAWVVRTREENAPLPWGAGLAVAFFCALVVAVALVVLSLGLADLPLMAVVINLVVGLGLAPAIWLVRSVPVLRWIGFGIGVGVVLGWCASAVALVSPLPGL